MDLVQRDAVFRCPRCRGKLLWEKEKCSECGAPFRVEDGIFDFISSNAMDEQNRAQIELHKVLVSKYKERYEPEYSKIYSRYWNKQFLSHLPENSLSVLDNGCGTGDLIRDIVPYGGLLIGSDISKAMIRRARDLIGERANITWVVSPSESLPFADNVFEVLCFRGALHHMADEISSLKEAYRVLRNGGLLMLSEPNDDSILLRVPRRIAKRRMARFGRDHKAFRSKKWLKTIREIGFSIQYTKYFSFLSQPLCGMSDVLPLMRMLPFSKPIGKFLVCFDELCSRVPIIKRQSFDLFVVAQKRGALS
jgi:ubiquinone/menaquinone biosynthesis C-methylase UbiE